VGLELGTISSALQIDNNIFKSTTQKEQSNEKLKVNLTIVASSVV